MATIDTIRQYFADILQRSGPEVTAAEIDAYVSAVDSGALTLAQIRSTMINSPEGQDVQAVIRIYQTVFGRVPDKQGLNDQVDDLRGPATVSDITNSFANSPEFISRFGSNTVSPVFIVAVYQQVLSRTPSAGEIQFYMDSGFSAGRIALAFSESPEFQNAYSASVVAFLHAAGEGTAVYTGALGNTLNVGEDFTLTQGTDAGVAFVGTDKDNVYNAPAEQTAFLPIQTLNDSDNLDGMGGRDVLNAGLTNLFTAPAGLNNIEEINLSAPAALFGAGLFTPTLDLANANSVDTLGFRGFSNGATINNLKTALKDINISDVVPNPLVLGLGDITVNHTGPALDGTDDSINLNVKNVGGGIGGPAGPMGIILNTTSAAAAAGYEMIHIDSTGAPNWVEVLGSATTATTTVNITGNADLQVNNADSGAPLRTWNAGTLDLIDATSKAGPFTGDLTTTVTGIGEVEVRGGEGENDLTFGQDVHATATGGSKNDIFRFASDGNDASFGPLDSVDGAGGDDILEIEADEDELLLAGVGANIVGVETIRHVTRDPITGVEDGLNGDLSVDMSRSGSATTLVLAGLYDNENVVVTELTNEDWVVYRPGLPTGGIDEDIFDLTLMHASPLGLSDHINLRMDSQQAPGGENEFEDDLIIDTGVELLNLDSIGDDGAGDNNIDEANNLDVDIIITGDHDLEIGVDDSAYDFANGVVDAAAFTGDLEIDLGENSQTVIGGSGDDVIRVEEDSTMGFLSFFTANDTIDLSAGGNDTVRFDDITENSFGSLAPDSPPEDGDYHNILGFDIADDLIQIDDDATDFNTTNGIDIGVGDFIEMLEVGAGTFHDGGAQSWEFIKFTAQVNTTGDNAQSAYAEAFGAGGITTPGLGAGEQVLASLYDATNQQMVLFTIENDATGGGAGGPNDVSPLAGTQQGFNANDDIDVITTVGMSYADYMAFNGDHISFVA
ncbi:DUF4214 domain-containing protein [Aurantimonas coralicida]|uniref:DUF4214 domain-containing protein n=1 Tax=Aurantimonas coralicida TaxID=182270 RepID=UPI001E606CFF|nr:DUF4214 domain-containing protein [Aurantimonas coralicida]MCD1645658.1 DUF4214 domain-containing protein [Aurantimonas coralicida]